MKVLALLLLIFFNQQSFAVCASPAGVAGELKWISTTLYFCNNASWIGIPGTVIASCAGITAGTIQYVGGEIRVCNGTNWLRTAPVVDHGTCVAGDAGKFYYGASYYWFCNGANWRRVSPTWPP